MQLVEGPDDQPVKALEVPPIWDIGATGCHDCKKEFSAILKRRFCRSCGHAYCMLCSPRAIILTKLGYGDPVRVCSFCFNGVTSGFYHSNSISFSGFDFQVQLVLLRRQQLVLWMTILSRK
jgi:hypothetical protein